MPVRTTPATCLFLFSALLVLIPARKTNAFGAGDPHPSKKTPDIYVLGVANDTIKYWKNGIATVIRDTGTADHTLSDHTTADFLFVSGKDVYVAGTTYHDQTAVIPHSTAKYWKNGIPAVLKDTTGHVRVDALFVSGKDVYVAGVMIYDPMSDPQHPYHAGDTIKSGHVATYWKNGELVSVPGAAQLDRGNGKIYSRHYDYLCSIFVAGNDVYLGGGSNEHKYGESTTYHFVQYWKNGVPSDLVSGIVNFDSTFNFPNATSMFFSGNDVYVAGYENFHGSLRAIYSKNGHWSYLPASGSFSVTNSIYVTGSGDVYIAGSDVFNGYGRAVYWKNGVEIPLSDGTYNAVALSLCVSGSDVYAAGYEQKDNTSYVTYWKNGVAVHLGKKGLARAIVVQ